MSEYKRLTKRDKHGKAQRVKMPTSDYIGAIYEEDIELNLEILDRLAELEDKIENGTLVELPCIAMVEQGLVDGKFKPTNYAQQFNGRYAVVYFDKSKLKKPLIDICWSKECTYDYYQAEARLKELKGENV